MLVAADDWSSTLPFCADTRRVGPWFDDQTRQVGRGGPPSKNLFNVSSHRNNLKLTTPHLHFAGSRNARIGSNLACYGRPQSSVLVTTMLALKNPNSVDTLQAIKYYLPNGPSAIEASEYLPRDMYIIFTCTNPSLERTYCIGGGGPFTVQWTSRPSSLGAARVTRITGITRVMSSDTLSSGWQHDRMTWFTICSYCGVLVLVL